MAIERCPTETAQSLKGLDQLLDIDIEQRQIYEAIARRDGAAAEQQMVNH
ncbi:hypothetical protein IQ273_05825 [Nodosilinea sp. LEGE 07298]|nr:hypothetical protein [Nodosilinea sp. LEGE 07298]MBE9108935.1 hypothetical protein [Nodosilinea sp. LEGE 07298]